ncbi:MAG: prolyl oligopeptidase family serine peptidase [Candidatus Aminicenantes bacterium]|nr:MAG: prolyl oligopeptidase family serine peptidase [Candidatus Aminicenantes bacterium]
MKKKIINYKIMTVCCLFASLVILFSAGNCSGGKNLAVYSEKTYNYLVYLPDKYNNNSQEPWPLIISLHGRSLRGDDLEKIKEYGLPRLIEKGNSFPFIIASPQCPADRTWVMDDWFPPLLEELKSKYRIDQSRIYLTGVNLGGEGVWYLATKYPEIFAAIAPVCGPTNALNLPPQARRIRHIPAWVFHGAKDLMIPLTESEAMVASLKEYGGDVTFEVFPEAGHSPFTNEVYGEQFLYEWFLSHKQSPFHQNGQKRCEGTFLDGKKHGKWIYWHENGNKEMEEEYIKGIPNGKWSYWDKQGVKCGEGEFLDGTGRWFQWYKSENKERLETYWNGDRHGRWLYWHENGRIHYQSEYKLGKPHGRWSGWSKYGNVIFDIGYMDGKPHGKWTYWNEKGEIIREETWNNGRLEQEKK